MEGVYCATATRESSTDLLKSFCMNGGAEPKSLVCVCVCACVCVCECVYSGCWCVCVCVGGSPVGGYVYVNEYECVLMCVRVFVGFRMFVV